MSNTLRDATEKRTWLHHSKQATVLRYYSLPANRRDNSLSLRLSDMLVLDSISRSHQRTGYTLRKIVISLSQRSRGRDPLYMQRGATRHLANQ
jgi:hypothetical protein